MASPSKGAASTTPPVTPVQSPAHRATGCDEKLKNPFQVLAGAPEEEESQHDGTETPSLDHSPHDPAHRALQRAAPALSELEEPMAQQNDQHDSKLLTAVKRMADGVHLSVQVVWWSIWIIWWSIWVVCWFIRIIWWFLCNALWFVQIIVKSSVQVANRSHAKQHSRTAPTTTCGGPPLKSSEKKTLCHLTSHTNLNGIVASQSTRPCSVETVGRPGQKMTLCHLTGKAAATAIVASQRFNNSESGMFGPMVYFARGMAECQQKALGGQSVLLTATVELGRSVVSRTGSHGNHLRKTLREAKAWLQSHGCDSVYGTDLRTGDEWAVPNDPGQIINIRVSGYHGRPAGVAGDTTPALQPFWLWPQWVHTIADSLGVEEADVDRISAQPQFSRATCQQAPTWVMCASTQ